MQGAELFLSLAEIAGVFVGFGALIAIRSGAAMEAGEVTGLRWVMTAAIWVVIAALVPILISEYGVTGHELWLVSGLIALALYVVMTVVGGRAPENRADRAATIATTPRAVMVLVYLPLFLLPVAAIVIALGIVILGLLPDQERALYFTAVGINLFTSAIMLFGQAFWRPTTSAVTGGAGPEGATASGA